MTPHNRPTSDVISSFNPNAINFKDEDKRRSFTPKQVNYEKYHLPSYKEQYLMGRKNRLEITNYNLNSIILMLVKQFKFQHLFSSTISACQKSSTPSKATHTTQHNLSTTENMMPDSSSKSNYKNAKTSFMAMKGMFPFEYLYEYHREVKKFIIISQLLFNFYITDHPEDTVPAGMKSLSNSAPNSPFMATKMGGHLKKDVTISNRTAVVQPNSSSINAATTITPDIGTY